MMWLGLWSASWMIHSPRSVSTTWHPAASRASLRSVSSVAIDFDFTTVRAPMRFATDAMYSLASAPSLAQYTWPPRAVRLSANCSRSSGRSREHVGLDRTRGAAQPVGVVQRGERGGAVLAEASGRPGEGPAQTDVCRRLSGAFAKRRAEERVAVVFCPPVVRPPVVRHGALPSSAAASTCAMWRV